METPGQKCDEMGLDKAMTYVYMEGRNEEVYVRQLVLFAHSLVLLYPGSPGWLCGQSRSEHITPLLFYVPERGRPPNRAFIVESGTTLYEHWECLTPSTRSTVGIAVGLWKW